MLHHVRGRKLSRSTHHRTSLFKNLVKALIAHGRLVTTKEKAKAIQGMIDRLVSQAKKGPVVGSRLVAKVIVDKKLTARLVGTIAPLFSDRPGGFTRIIPLGPRRADTANMVRLEWVVAPVEKPIPAPFKKLKSPKSPKISKSEK
jgi:large subunit ribosomal protein L17